MNDWLALFLGSVALYSGAEALVKSGAGLALRLGLTPLVIGLTVIAFGTSSPELVVSLDASLTGNGAISIGNVIGSNVCNIALILGLCALIAPLKAEAQVVRREVPIMIGVTAIGVLALADGYIARWEGGLWRIVRGVHASDATAQRSTCALISIKDRHFWRSQIAISLW